MNTNQLPFVQIFMCTFNGDKFIEDQLQSIETQTYLNWKLIVSDDGSRDRTLKILFEYQKKWSAKKIEIVKGPRLGFSANFLSLIQNKKYKADYFFLSDQDDVWHPKKIEDYLYNFTKLKKDVPHLIGGRTVYVNEDLFLLGESINYTHPPSFKNSLVQSMFGGNTIAFNKKLKYQMEKIKLANVSSYDWLIYQINTALNGKTIFLRKPYIFYRQHKDSMVGKNTSLIDIMYRFYLVIKNEYRNAISTNIKNLQSLSGLNEVNKKILENFISMRKSNMFKRFEILFQYQFFRKKNFGFIVTLLVVLFKKI